MNGETKEIATQDPSQLIALAITQNADVDKLERLMALQERWNAQKAKESFFMALSEFQNKCPVIIKSKAGYSERYFYAPLDKIVEAIRQPLYDCKLTYRWEQVEEGDKINVTCIITHVAGHSERMTLSGLADDSGNKNDIQAKGSTVQYLRRYTLEGALGIATGATDNDGKKKQIETITEEQVADLTALIEELGDAGDKGKQALFEWLSIESLDQIPAKQYKKAVAGLEKRRQA